jgi:hypothetical protein
MKIEKELLLSFLLMATVFILFSIPATQNLSSNKYLVLFSYLMSIPFIVINIVDINSSSKLNYKYKRMWTFSFIVMPLLAGIVYLFWKRKCIVS